MTVNIVPAVIVSYAATGTSTKANELGMRPMSGAATNACRPNRRWLRVRGGR